MSNEELYERAMGAISELFSDPNVDRSTTMNNLDSLIGEIRIMLEALDDDAS